MPSAARRQVQVNVAIDPEKGVVKLHLTGLPGVIHPQVISVPASELHTLRRHPRIGEIVNQLYLTPGIQALMLGPDELRFRYRGPLLAAALGRIIGRMHEQLSPSATLYVNWPTNEKSLSRDDRSTAIGEMIRWVPHFLVSTQPPARPSPPRPRKRRPEVRVKGANWHA